MGSENRPNFDPHFPFWATLCPSFDQLWPSLVDLDQTFVDSGVTICSVRSCAVRRTPSRRTVEVLGAVVHWLKMRVPYTSPAQKGCLHGNMLPRTNRNGEG